LKRQAQGHLPLKPFAKKVFDGGAVLCYSCCVGLVFSMGDYIYQEKYIWDTEKAVLNLKNHHISFEAAALVFDDPFMFEVYDFVNSTIEDRYNATGEVIGVVNKSLITVSVTYRGDLIRIFSARDADSAERGEYRERLKAYFG
jgi:uncharacterized DUF497 family protein